MYICLCNGLTDKQVKEVLHGAKTVDDIYERLNAQVNCGKCAECILEMMNDIQNDVHKLTA